MKAFTQSAAAAGFAAVLLLSGCAHHNSMASSTSNDVGTITTDQAAQSGVIAGPAKVDSDDTRGDHDDRLESGRDDN